MSSTFKDTSSFYGIVTVQEDTFVTDNFGRQFLKITAISTEYIDKKHQTSVPRDKSSSVFSMIVAGIFKVKV